MKLNMLYPVPVSAPEKYDRLTSFWCQKQAPETGRWPVCHHFKMLLFIADPLCLWLDGSLD